MRGKKAQSRLWSKPVVAAAAAAGLVSVVALVWSFPLLLGMDQVLLGFPGDSLSTLQRWENWQVSARYVERPLLNVTGRALSTAIGPLLTYNLMVLASFPLSALTAFALCYRLVPRRLPALCGAMVFALSPFHWAHGLGHIYEAHIQWVPLVALAALAFASRPTPLTSLSIVLASVVLIGSSFYYGFFVAVVSIPLLAAWALFLLARRNARRLLYTVIAVAGVFLITLPVTHSYLTWLIRQRITPPTHGEDLFRYSARLNEYVMPGAFSAIRRLLAPSTRPGSLHLSNEVEQSIFLGWVPLGLAVVGLVALIRGGRDSGVRRGELCWILGAGILAALFSAPPVVQLGSGSLRMPSYYIGSWVPFFRTYARMAVIVSVAVSCAATAGIAWLTQRRSRLIGALLALLVLVEYTPMPPPRVVRLLPLKGVYGWLAREGKGGTLVEYPMGSRVTPRTSVRSYMTRFSGNYSLEETVSFDLRHTGTLDTMRCRNLSIAGVKRVLMHDRNPDPPLQVYKDRSERGLNLPGDWPGVPDHGEVSLTAHFPETVVFDIADAPSAVSLSLGDGMGPWVEGPRPLGRPLLAESYVVLQSRARRPSHADVELDFVPVRAFDSLRCTLNGTRIAEYAVEDTMRIVLPGIETLPGANMLRLEAVGSREESTAHLPVGRLLGVWIINHPEPVEGTRSMMTAAPDAEQ